MSIIEQDSNNQQRLLIPSSSIDNDRVAKTRRSSSIATMLEPVLLIAAEEEEDDNNGETVTASRPFALSGILYGLLASFLYVTATFIVKELEFDLLDVLVVRLIVQLFLFLAFVIYHRYAVLVGSSKEKWLQFILCILTGIAFLGFFIGFRYLPLPDLTTLSFSRLIWTVLFGLLIYKEKPTIMILLSVCFTFIGVIFVAQPTFIFPQKNEMKIAFNITTATLNETNVDNMHSYSNRVIGISLALMSGLIFAFNILIFKQLITLKIKPSVLILQHSLVVLLCLILNHFYKYFFLNDITFFTLTIFQWKYWLAGLISLGQTLAVIAGNCAIKREPPSIVTIVSSVDIIYAITLQNLFTQKKSNLWVLLGSTLVVSSVVLIGLDKFMQERKIKKKKLKMATVLKTEK
ncbi:unnamed protein product [Adineta steineri]|uniref:EamA domain-containing protein n=1 Tax=Adineta steineri TaxID=433720 RepID=A0A814VD70_9BILA|nr:unnamed protein product [Adineta steineri]CAF1435962.1 unnamed protein product [Adineta steineri]